MPSSVSAENMAQAGWDSLSVDLQHGLVDYQTAVTMFQAIATTPTMPLARVPWLEPGIIMKLPDAGAFVGSAAGRCATGLGLIAAATALLAARF